MGVIDMVRRLAFGSYLLFLNKYNQILAALCFSVFVVVGSRELNLHYTLDMNRVYHFSAVISTS